MRHKTTKVRRARKSRSFFYTIATVAVSLGVGLGCVAMLHAEGARTQYEIDLKVEELKNLEQEHRELVAQLTELQSPAVLYDKAKELGMVKPEVVEYIMQDQSVLDEVKEHGA